MSLLSTNQPQELHKLWRRSVEASHEFLSSAEINEIDKQLTESRFFHQQDLQVHKNESGAIQAFLLTSETQKQTHIEALFVDPAFFGSGIGSQLVQNVVEQATRKGHTSVIVEVNEQNPRAAGFYAKHGFKQYSRSELDDQGRPYPLLRLSRQLASATLD